MDSNEYTQKTEWANKESCNKERFVLNSLAINKTKTGRGLGWSHPGGPGPHKGRGGDGFDLEMCKWL